MHLKSLTLKGFKSFASATTLKFEPGICAVVGPNGSGKSNVVDALAWVMGEQGAKTLRGGKMQDVIFAGAGERKPLGRAEVTLTIDNSDGKLPIEYSEVSVTRRMFRDGAAEYEINGSKARLMDIQELLSDTGIGREMHIIVGQGKLAEILDSRPEERRSYIEEAAGVLKHRRRKEKAQRKLTGMQANLDRLRDLTDELSKQLKPLARQAEAAQRAATVQADLREARLRLAAHRVIDLRAALSDTAKQAAILGEQVDEVTAELEERSGEQAEIELELEEIQPQADAASQLWFRLSTLTERAMATRRIAVERASRRGDESTYSGPDPDELEARAHRADEEHDELAEHVAVAEARLETLRDEVAEREEVAQAAESEYMATMRAIADRREGVVRLIAAEESAAERVTSAKAELGRLSEAIEAATGRLEKAKQEKITFDGAEDTASQKRRPLQQAQERAAAEAEAAESRLEELRQRQREREEVVHRLSSRIETLEQSAPTQAATDVAGADQLLPLAHQLSVEPGLEHAVTAALGGHAEALTGAIGAELLGRLKEANVGRTSLIRVSSGSEKPWRMSARLPRGCSWLLDHIELNVDIAPAVTRLLADVVFAHDESAAMQVVEGDPRLRAVTNSGMLFGENWVQLGTSSRSSVEVNSAVESARSELAQASDRLEELSGAMEGARQAAEEARIEAASAMAALREHDGEASTRNRESQRIENQVQASQKEFDQVNEQYQQAKKRLEAAEEQLESTRDRLDRAGGAEGVADDDEHYPDTASRDAAATALAQSRAMETEARLALRTAEERAAQAAGRGEGLRRQAAHERSARARHDEAQAKRQREIRLASTVGDLAAALVERATKATELAAARRDELTNEKNQLTSRLSKAKDQVNAARQQVSRLSDKAHSSEIARSQAQVRVDEAEEKIVEQLGVSIADLIHEHAPGQDFDLAAEKARLKQAEKDLTALGKVNPLALEEYKALEERYGFLSTQLADVEQARTDLEGVVADVDEQILDLFTRAWHDVEAEFPKVFSTLFPGGEGRLVLTDPSDMLTTGIELEARPPGKKVKRLSLLSGGEKSLTALAMLVAIFRARPSPFYVMDEVEAALDDVNLRRLIALFEELRKDSQLIVITHQKPTMDIANVLYGVTMRGDGVTKVISQRMAPASAATGE